MNTQETIQALRGQNLSDADLESILEIIREQAPGWLPPDEEFEGWDPTPAPRVAWAMEMVGTGRWRPVVSYADKDGNPPATGNAQNIWAGKLYNNKEEALKVAQFHLAGVPEVLDGFRILEATSLEAAQHAVTWAKVRGAVGGSWSDGAQFARVVRDKARRAGARPEKAGWGRGLTYWRPVVMLDDGATPLDKLPVIWSGELHADETTALQVAEDNIDVE